MSRPFRILYYNWVDYTDAEGRGGGVTLYQRNVIEGLEAHRDIEAVFLSSGLSYDLRTRPPRWEATRHGAAKSQKRRFELVNSGVFAPAHSSFGDPSQVSHPATRAAFFDFVAQTGPYDVIHFNNLEGLPADVLTIKQQHPQTQIILSLHNYYPICPQVNLWANERQSCDDFAGGARCITCLPQQANARLLRVSNAVSYRLRCAGLQPGTWGYDVAFRGALGVGRRGLRAMRWLRQKSKQQPAPASPTAHLAFTARRADITALINANCDYVLCVSDAVRVLAQRYGILPELTRTSYIGTRAAALFGMPSLPAERPVKKTLTLGYLGYMRRDKGFFFLLDALEALPAGVAAQVCIVIAARAGDRATMERVARLKDHLAGVIYHDGYTHAQLETVLAPVDVGVVPVLWHDNLPQVAIEMHARHIPLLTAAMGGASELGNCPDMVFAPGDVGGFARSVQALLAGHIDFAAYWRGAMAPLTVDAHISELLEVYQTPAK
ncbi:glycosyltransferase [Pseudorhodobacter sp. W20_MBD10_FR17]|uniref:glycosyltransferase n=1 Tax=Pseudorhodobacter sp. W20_MBD10_FR17 TaxID=3240266 RepID=UPI003F974B6E